MSGSAVPGRALLDTPDDPRAYIAGDRRRALVAGESMPERVTGAALFADISGFTPLTEALATELGAHRGAEELVANLNRILAALIEDLHRYGGEVIYFSGDAITCWIDGDDGSKATACALLMQETMRRVGVVETAAGTSVETSLKAAVAVGEARRFAVGDPDLQLIDVLAGSLIDDLAAAEQGDVVLDESAFASLGPLVAVGHSRHDGNRTFGIVERLQTEVPAKDPAGHLEEVSEEVPERWLLPTIYERLAGGGGAFPAELRTVYPMFIRFGGLDFDDDPAAAAKLDEFVRKAQHALDSFGSWVKASTSVNSGPCSAFPVPRRLAPVPTCA